MTLRCDLLAADLGLKARMRFPGDASRTLALAGLAAAFAVSAPWFAPYDIARPSFDALLAPPGAAHLLGADELGRDVLSRLLAAGQTSVGVAMGSVAASLIVGAAAGMSAGYFGRWIDALAMRVFDLVSAFPAVLLALTLGATLGPGLRNVMIAIAAVNLPVFARLARTQTLLVRELGFVEARRALGFGPLAILFGTVAPNIAPPLLTQACLLVGSSILLESYLSFLGVGVQPPAPTLGRMLHDGMGFLDQAPWLVGFPGLAVFIVVLGFNLVGDWMNDRLDPREIWIGSEAEA